jgi:hypothetical protein
MTMVWTTESNISNNYSKFTEDITKITASDNWTDCFYKCCAKNDIIPYTMFRAVNVGPQKISCGLHNCAIDLANWRAMLIACASTGVIEINFSNLKLDIQHLKDLGIFLQSTSQIEILKLDYIETDSNLTEFNIALSQVISNCSNVTYLSLRGSAISDDTLNILTESIKNCMTLEYLNLSHNHISDIGFVMLSSIIPSHPSLKSISLRRNNIHLEYSERLINSISDVMFGKIINNIDETELKALSKLVTEKNKKIKEINKSRKKSNLPEYVEIDSPSDWIIKSSTPGVNSIRNQSFLCVDISYNNNNASLRNIVEVLVQKSSVSPYASVGAGKNGPVGFIVKGSMLSSEDIEMVTSQNFGGFMKIQVD